MSIDDGDGNAISSGTHAEKKLSLTKQNVALAAIAGLAIFHVLVICFAAHPLLPSNIIQFIAPLLATALCLVQARYSNDRYFRRLWEKLCIAFLLWTVAQGDYLWHVICHKSPPHFPSLTDFLWLLSSFPILLVASRAKDRTEDDWPGLLDIAQGCISACLLYAVLFWVPQGITDSLVFDIQSTALVFACAIRYSTATGTSERIFFRNLTLYSLCYGILSAAGLLAQDYGSAAGGITDLAWSLPVLFFCIIALQLPENTFPFSEKGLSRTILPAHIHGISSLGLALTSMAAGVILTLHRPRWGIFALTLSCILFAVRTALRESQLKRAQLKLEHDTLYDSLTGLANRTLLIRDLEQSELAFSQPRSLLFLDLDRFKIINDSLGHAFGDRLLVHVAGVLRSAVRNEDIVARLGGDEFVILLNGDRDGITAEGVAERILHSLRSPILLDGRVIHITGSIGIVAVQEGKTTTDLLRDADASMYVAKSLGKNRAHVFDQSILEKTTRELEMEADLRHAMKEGLIAVAYQPIYSVETEQLEGFEALARWTHPKYGVISPAEFIPLAEDTGLIIELGKQVLSIACYQVAAWNSHFHSKLTVSVNVSGRQLADKGFLSYVKEILNDSQLEPALLKFEITETVLLSDRQGAEETFGTAHSMGIGIYLDDFGTGYSSLSYLLEFPFDTIKIDRCFMQNVDCDNRRAEMMHTIVKLAKNLGKNVIAEGIETLAQLEFIAKLRCDSVQGFLFSRPLLAEAMTKTLKSEMRGLTVPLRQVKDLTLPLAQ